MSTLVSTAETLDVRARPDAAPAAAYGIAWASVVAIIGEIETPDVLDTPDTQTRSAEHSDAVSSRLYSPYPISVGVLLAAALAAPSLLTFSVRLEASETLPIPEAVSTAKIAIFCDLP